MSGSHYSSDTHHRRRHNHRYHHQKRNRNFPFSLLPFRSPNVSLSLVLVPNNYFINFLRLIFKILQVRPFFPRNHISLRYLGMWPATFQQLVEVQFNENGFNLPYHDGRALSCTYILPNNRCVDHYRLRYL